MRQAAIAVRSDTAPDQDVKTLHIRCGSDIKNTLREAGFTGDFLEYSNPFCQGPVTNTDDWLQRRTTFVAEFYGRDPTETAARLQHEESSLRTAAERYERVVLWFEHDSYDQLVFARCLAQFADKPPQVLELVTANHFPGAARFIGLGQLPPEALRLLWTTRRAITRRQLTAARSVWCLLRAPDPTPLAALATAGIKALPDMARAVLRHCQELPWTTDGLSLTERLTLQLLSDSPKTVGQLFSSLMHEREPLPWLGDIMFWRIIQGMKRTTAPVFTAMFDGGNRAWPCERLTISDLGRNVLAGITDYLSLTPPPRWVGGVQIVPGSQCWRWDSPTATTLLQ